MSHALKITLDDEAHAEAIERLRPFRKKEGGEATAGRKFLLRGMGLPEPGPYLVADESLLRRLIREEIRAAREVTGNG